MKNALERLTLLARSRISHFVARNAQQRRREQSTAQAVERLVDQVNPRLRAASGYRKRLSPVVERALAHAKALARQVPGPLRIDRRTWNEDPVVNALFGSPDRMRWVLTSKEVRRYVKDNPLGGDCFAVLAVMPAVRQQLGMELMGETLQRDVRQTAVSFAEHQVLLPADSEQEARDALADGAFELLVSLAEQGITEQESRIVESEDRLRILRLKRKVADSRSHGAALLLDDSAEHLQELHALDARIGEVEAELAEARKGLESLDDRLARLVERLEHPETLLGLQAGSVRLDRMNIVREGDDSGAELSFTRVLRGGKPMRVVFLIQFPRSELLDEDERLREVERHLA